MINMKQLTIMEVVKLCTGEHINYHYSSILGKMIFPCAINPLDCNESDVHKNICFSHVFDNKSKYEMIR